MSLKIENVDIHGWEAAIRGARNPMNSWEKSDSWFIDRWDIEMKEFYCHSLDIYSAIMEETGELTNDGHSIMEVMWMTINAENEWLTATTSWPYAEDENYKYCVKLILGQNDYKLLKNLCKGGSEESKWRRFVTVSMDLTAPLYWWKEFDTYKVGTACNSCSTMHKIHAKEFTIEDFSCEHLSWGPEHDGTETTLIAKNGDSYVCEVVFPMAVMKDIIDVLNHNRQKFLETKDKKYWWQMIQLLPTSYNQRRTIILNYEVLAKQYRERKNHKLDCWHTYCDWIKTLPYSELITMEEKA